MRVAIFGSGLMGSAVARDLVRYRDVEGVTVCDVDQNKLRALSRIEPSSKLSIKVHDVRRMTDTIRLLRKFDIAVGALPHALCEYPIRAALQAQLSLVDLIFGWRFERDGIHEAAKRRGIMIIPACGLAPGLTNILAKHAADQMDRVDEIHIKTGGLPEKPEPPLNYRIVFSFEAVLEEYLRKARIIHNGRVVDVEALSGLETVTFPRPIGKCECFYTDGLSTLVRTIKGVREMDEKTIRWPGHVAQIRTLIDCGLLEADPVTVDGQQISPRKLVVGILSKRLALGRGKDITLLRVDVTGRIRGRRAHQSYEMIDHYDAKLKMTSMARTTAFPCSIVTHMIGAGLIRGRGVVPPEIAVNQNLYPIFMKELSQRGIRIKSNQTLKPN